MKRIIIPTIALYIILLLGCVSCGFAPGSYPYAERYEICCSESVLIDAVEKFKRDNPEYVVPLQAQLKDGRSNENDHWCHVYFYYKKDNEIVYAWIRKSDDRTTILAFVSINNGLTLGNWKDINHGYSNEENTLQKEKFERLILSGIKKQIH